MKHFQDVAQSMSVCIYKKRYFFLIITQQTCVCVSSCLTYQNSWVQNICNSPFITIHDSSPLFKPHKLIFCWFCFLNYKIEYCTSITTHTISHIEITKYLHIVFWAHWRIFGNALIGCFSSMYFAILTIKYLTLFKYDDFECIK